ncbi:hypothetical protein Q4519_06930 [Motilimonas sp. 1_MG-2023]|uniref:hypothetical protein n=1 Tax=Motilimonas sp. 1_MG-2023 TaxID=3062672 RepID=UPI0026E44E86|nr:hypothetical protein [Motilimonas sp. 1_MG-2023]MDO6525415.1 hypothetical protein [Motilimonas sp. 1_MG-2023]
MQHITVLRQMTNYHIAQFNRYAVNGMAASVEFQTECILEVLAEMADRCDYADDYRAISDRINQLHLHCVIDPVAEGDNQ